MPLDNPKNLGDCAVALGWETTEGCAASTYQNYLQAEVKLARNQMVANPQGTHGSMWQRQDGRREAAYKPTAEVTCYGTKQNMAHFLASLVGRTIAQGANVSEAGDAGNFVSGWNIRGLRPRFNMESANRIYCMISDEVPASGYAQVSLYKESAMTTLLARASGANSTTLSLIPQNSYGVSGQVNLGAPSANDSNVILTINTLEFLWRNQPDDTFSLRVWSGCAQHTLTGCVVSEVRFTSSEGAPELKMGATIQGKVWAETSGSPSVANIDYTTFVHGDVTVVDEPSGANATKYPRSLELRVSHPTESFVGNAYYPQKHIRKGWREIGGALAMPYTDEVETLFRAGQNVSHRDLRMTYVYGGASFQANIYGVKWSDEIPGIGRDELDDYAGTFEAYYDGSASAAVVFKLDLA